MPDPSPSLDLRKANLRRTPVREGVLSVLSAAASPLGAVEILEKLPPSTGAVTVYRTLNTLLGKQLIHRVQSEDRTWRYAIGNASETHARQHPHFVCDTCGTVECLRRTEIPKDFVRHLGVSRNYEVSYPEVVLHGTCPKCR